MTVTDNFSPDGPVSLDFASLTQAYRDGSLTPSRLVKDIFVRMEGRGDDKVWIYRVPATVLLARAAALEALSAEGRAALPLWGIPFAVKDNIDVAGLATTAACPARDEKAKTNALW